MLNFLVITPFFSPNIGGVETFLTNLCKMYNNKKIHITVLTLKPVTTNTSAKNFELINSNMTKIYRFNFINSNFYHKTEKNILFNFFFIFPYFFFRIFFFIFFNKKKKNYNLISAHGFHSLLISFFLKKILHIKCNFFVHSTYDNFKSSFFKNFLFAILLKIPDKIFCNSFRTKKIISKFTKKKIEIFQYNVNTNIKYLPNLKKFNILSILFVGRLIKKKGIEIFNDLSKQFSDINFHIVGNGPYEEFINKEQKNIFFYGYLPNDSVSLSNLYNKSHYLFMMPIYEEAYGIVFQESVITGTPVIVNKNIEVAKIINKNNLGFLLTPNKKILINFFLDKRKLLKYSLVNRIRISKFGKKTFSSLHLND
jgi:glycosyltransferase involved in cell wall biosynthesis